MPRTNPPSNSRANRAADLSGALDLDRRSPLPLYHQIAEKLRQRIEDGRLEPGTLLGNEVQLAEQLIVSRPTLRKAIAELVEQGLLVRRRGLGTVVLPNSIKRRLAEASLFDHLTRTKRSPSTRVLKMASGTVPADVRAILRVDSDQRILKITRLRYADSVPLALMTNWVPGGMRLSQQDLERVGLYNLLRQFAVVPSVVDQTIGARLASEREASLLEIKKKDPVLTVDIVAYDSAGRAVDVGRHVYRADRYSFEITHVES